MPEELTKLVAKQVLITRAKGQNKKLSQALHQLGAIPIEFPTIKIVPPDNLEPLDEAITNLSQYDWLIFSSTNAVKHFWQRLIQLGKTVVNLNKISIAAVGPATATALQKHNLNINLMPSKHTAQALVATIGDVNGQHILLPTTDIARPTLFDGLQAKGAIVNRVNAYQTVFVTELGNLDQILPTIDVLTFTSPSTVQSLFALLKTNFKSDSVTAMLKSKIIACIGPVTAEAAEALGLEVHVMPQNYTVSGLVDALNQFYNTQNSNRKVINYDY